MKRARRLLALAVSLVVSLALVAAVPGAVPHDDDWRWPVDGVRIVRDWEAPAHRYGPGHRGIDVAPAAGDAVVAPNDGVVAFAGMVAGRPVVTIDHGGGVVTTLEPVVTTAAPGDAVRTGDVIGVIGEGGHAPPGAVHFGIRVDGEYVNPRLFVGGVPRAVLLPCC